MKRFLLLLILSLITTLGCSLLSPTRETDYTLRGDKSKLNDPTSINILAYMLGGSVLVSSVAGIYYRHKQSKNGKE